jgi:hypothetical protein
MRLGKLQNCLEKVFSLDSCKLNRRALKAVIYTSGFCPPGRQQALLMSERALETAKYIEIKKIGSAGSWCEPVKLITYTAVGIDLVGDTGSPVELLP